LRDAWRFSGIWCDGLKVFDTRSGRCQQKHSAPNFSVAWLKWLEARRAIEKKVFADFFRIAFY